MNCRLVIQLSLVLVIGGVLNAEAKERPREKDRVDILDVEDTNKIADIICSRHDGNRKLFEKMATIERLVDYISHSTEPKMVACWEKYGESLLLANKVVTTSEEDICDDRKISLMEEFHHKYISKTRRDVKEQDANQYAAPHMLTIYFIHYLKEVGKICKDNVVRNIRDLMKNSKIEADSNGALFNVLLEKFDRNFEFSFSTGDQKNMFLVWNLVDEIAHENGKGDNEFSNYVNLADELASSGPNSHRVTLKMRDTVNLQVAQDYCRKHLRPVYSRSILPVLRLIDMGYYFPYLENDISQDAYKRTQFCETILPIRAVADVSLQEGQIVLIPKSEAAKLSSVELEKQTVADPIALKRNNLGWKGLYHLSSDLTKQINQILDDIKERKNLIKRYLHRMQAKIQALSEAKKSSFFLASKGEGDANEREDMTEAIGQSLKELNEPTVEERRKDKVHQLAKKVWTGIKKVFTKMSLPFVFVGCLLTDFAQAMAERHLQEERERYISAYSAPAPREQDSSCDGYEGMSAPMIFTGSNGRR